MIEVPQIVGEDGSYLWSGLRGGTYTVTAWYDGRSGAATVRVAAAEDVTADLHVPAG